MSRFPVFHGEIDTIPPNSVNNPDGTGGIVHPARPGIAPAIRVGSRWQGTTTGPIAPACAHCSHKAALSLGRAARAG